MKQTWKIGTLIATSVASLVSTAVAEPAGRACQQFLDALPTIERTCLSGSATQYAGSFRGAIGLLRRTVDGRATVSAEEIRGARKDLEGELQKPENDAIRECMRGYQTRLLNCLENSGESHGVLGSAPPKPARCLAKSDRIPLLDNGYLLVRGFHHTSGTIAVDLTVAFPGTLCRENKLSLRQGRSGEGDCPMRYTVTVQTLDVRRSCAEVSFETLDSR